MMHAWCTLFFHDACIVQYVFEARNVDAKHSNVSLFDHDACMVQFVFEERNEDVIKALKCFFV
jgi:hypothetical protein